MLSFIALLSVILGVTAIFGLVSQGGLYDETRTGVVLAMVVCCVVGGIDVSYAENVRFYNGNQTVNQQNCGEDGTRSCP